MTHQHVDDVKATPIVIGFREKIRRNSCVSSEIDFHSMNQMWLMKKDFFRWPLSSIIVP